MKITVGIKLNTECSNGALRIEKDFITVKHTNLKRYLKAELSNDCSYKWLGFMLYIWLNLCLVWYGSLLLYKWQTSLIFGAASHF